MNPLRLSSVAAGVLVVATLVACSSPRSAATVPQPAPILAPAVAQPGQSQVPDAGPTRVQVTASDRVAPHHVQRKQQSPEIEHLLATVDPERIYQTAEAKPGVPLLKIIGPGEQRISAGGSALLQVQGAPDSVVTFTTRDGGVFDNQAASITVLADETGAAQTQMHAPSGTYDDVPVFVGSPNAVGTTTLIVHVLYDGSALTTSSVSR